MPVPVRPGRQPSGLNINRQGGSPVNKRQATFMSVLAVSVALSAAACRSSSQDSTSTKGSSSGVIDTKKCPSTAFKKIDGDTIKFATSGPLSGNYAGAGEVMKGAKAYFDWVNAKGGVETVDGKKKLALDVQDDQFSPSKTQANIRRSVEQDGAVATVSIIGDAGAASVAPYLNQKCVPLLFPAAGGRALLKKDEPFSTLAFSYYDQGVIAGRYIAQKDPDATIAILYLSSGSGNDQIAGLEEGIKGTGVKIVAKESIEPTTTDVSSQMTTLAASDATVFYDQTSATVMTQSLNILGAMSWKPSLYTTDAAADIAVAQADGDSAVGSHKIAYLQPVTADTPGIKQYNDVMKAGGVKVTNTSLLGYSYALLAVETIEQAKELSSVGLAEASKSLPADPPAPSVYLPGVTLESKVGAPAISSYQMSEWDPKTQGYGANLTPPISVK
jgi:branched-chain amino acid transport system substrate-binding protein